MIGCPMKNLSPTQDRPSTGTKAGDATRERILDSAEELFALRGYDGTSMRDVAVHSGDQVALVTYHFKTKDLLFDRVVGRRAVHLAYARIQMLDAARQEADGQAIAIRKLVEGYVWPFVERSDRGGKKWKYYLQLCARLANSPQWAEVISKHYDSVARQFLVEFRRSVPDVAEAEVYHAFTFMVGTMVATVAEAGRVERLSNGKISPPDLESVFDVMLPFLEAGFMSLAAKHLSKIRVKSR